MKTHFLASLPRSFATSLAIVAMLFVSAPQSGASRYGAQIKANVLFDALRIKGWTVRDLYTWGLLSRGQSTVVQTTLYAGNTYTLAAAGCEDAYDVDLAVFDENGNLIGRDSDASQLAVVTVTPRWSGTFFLKVTMYDSTSDGAHYVLQYAYTGN